MAELEPIISFDVQPRPGQGRPRGRSLFEVGIPAVAELELIISFDIQPDVRHGDFRALLSRIRLTLGNGTALLG